jgi:hypothetical protein
LEFWAIEKGENSPLAAKKTATIKKALNWQKSVGSRRRWNRLMRCDGVSCEMDPPCCAGRSACLVGGLCAARQRAGAGSLPSRQDVFFQPHHIRIAPIHPKQEQSFDFHRFYNARPFFCAWKSASIASLKLKSVFGPVDSCLRFGARAPTHFDRE